eukprot:jgi/Mesvir1/4083/Mv08616-RA.1
MDAPALGLARFPPLCNPCDLFSEDGLAVPLQLDEPLWPLPIGELLAICAYASIIAEKREKALHQTYMSLFYPELMKALGEQGAGLEDCTPGKDYLQEIASLNQLLSMSNQLQESACDRRNHKYMAHMVALLYQSLSQVRAGLKSFKSDIEAHFEDIKAMTEREASPMLSKDLQLWLESMTRGLRSTVAQLPQPILRKLSPVADVMREQKFAAPGIPH